MSKAVFITPLAELDAYDAVLWYNLKEPGLGNKFLQKFKEKIQAVTENPEQFQKRLKDIRIAHINKFPYGISFVIEQHRIVITAVLHSKRHPRTWKTRPKQ